MLHSIPIKELFSKQDIKYRKIEVISRDLTNKYNIESLPALLFFQKGKLIGKVEGYYETKDKKVIKRKVNKILNLS